MRHNYAIGVFDSGIGGISVLQTLKQLLPNEHFQYIADSQYAPYGEKTDEFIIKRCLNIVEFLLLKNVKAIVIACNTATAATIDVLRERYQIPIIGIEPGVKPAILASNNGNIGVMATTSTLQSAKFANLMDEYTHNNKVMVQQCPGLVDHIEQGDFNSSGLVSLLNSYLSKLHSHDVDTIVLGCTHYYLLKPAIEHYFDYPIEIIDVRLAVAMQLKRQLEIGGLLIAMDSGETDQYWSSGNIDHKQQVIKSLIGCPIEIKRLPKLT